MIRKRLLYAVTLGGGFGAYELWRRSGYRMALNALQRDRDRINELDKRLPPIDHPMWKDYPELKAWYRTLWVGGDAVW